MSAREMRADVGGCEDEHLLKVSPRGRRITKAFKLGSPRRLHRWPGDPKSRI